MATSPTELRVAIIGAGMGGLTAALALAKKGFKNIDIYEQASSLGFVGAGIQLAPNMARVLDGLGVWDGIAKAATNIQDTSIRQGPTDQELSHVKLQYIHETYGYPHMVGHRASLAGAIYEGCKAQSAVKFHMGCILKEVDSYNFPPTFTYTTKEGTTHTVEADVLLGADGIKSATRVKMLQELGVDAQIIDTKQAAYRIMLTREEFANDPELLALLDSDTVTRWIGEKKHIIAYSVENKSIYNLSTAQPDVNFAEAPSSSYQTKGSKKQMLETFADFCPKVQRMLNMVPEGEVVEWKLRVHHPLPTWVHGCTALLGDACHPTLPHLAQGAAQAIEDAAVIAVVLSRLPDTTPVSINKALHVYERVRKSRAETLVELAAASGRALHLGDGKAKEERDRQFAEAKAGGKGVVPDKWADADVQRQIYGFDCVAVAEEKFGEYFEGAVVEKDLV